MNKQPLSGFRVIDFSHSWAAPHCARMLGDFGAEVIKVEYIRRLCLLRGARVENRIYDTHPGWLQVNRNKLSITLDLNIESDREAFTELIRTADVLIENSRPGVMDRLGFGYNNVSSLNSGIIFLSMSAFGNSGPYAKYSGYGAVFEALGGIQCLTSYQKDGKPYRIKEIDVTNGLAGACAVMTALAHRAKTGEGQYIDLSQFEAASHALIGEHLLEYEMNGAQTLPLGNRHERFAPQGCYRSKGDDKWVTITIRSEEEWQRFCEITGHSEWTSDPRFCKNQARMQNHDVLDELIERWTLSFTHYEAMEIMQENGIAAAAVLSPEDICSDPHLSARGYFVYETSAPDKEFMGLPYRMSYGAGEVRSRGPALGQHNEYVFSELLSFPGRRVKPVREDEIGTAFDT